MKLEDLKKHYGDEYPATVFRDGIRMPLCHERRFSRFYRSEEHKMGVLVSRFMDGSASMTAMQLQQEWPTWTESEQVDFCQESGWLREQADFLDMLRFIMEYGNALHWSGIALDIAGNLPQNEAFHHLTRALHASAPGHASNITNAIAKTKHPDAETTLRRHLAMLWSHPNLWDAADFTNWVAFDAVTCIRQLIEQGAPPDNFADQVRQLSTHVCPGIRESCCNFLSKYYSWLQRNN